MIIERGGEDTSSMDSHRIKAEVFSQLMGAEQYGRVRGYGIGITPTQLSAVSRFTQESRDGSADVHVLGSRMRSQSLDRHVMQTEQRSRL